MRLCAVYAGALDRFHNESLDFVEYVELDRLLSESDLISLHCPLDDTTYHLIDERTIDMMKNGVILVNTSRGAIVNTDALIKGIRDMKFHAVNNGKAPVIPECNSNITSGLSYRGGA